MHHNDQYLRTPRGYRVLFTEVCLSVFRTKSSSVLRCRAEEQTDKLRLKKTLYPRDCCKNRQKEIKTERKKKKILHALAGGGITAAVDGRLYSRRISTAFLRSSGRRNVACQKPTSL